MMYYITFWDCPFSNSIILWRFIQVVVCIDSQFIVTVEEYSTERMNHSSVTY